MGWTGHHNRDSYCWPVGKTWTSEGRTITVLKHHRAGAEDWFLLQAGDVKVITLMLWDGGMVKHMDAACHPYYYACPLAWLDEVPPGGEFEQEWRSRVRSFARLSA